MPKNILNVFNVNGNVKEVTVIHDYSSGTVGQTKLKHYRIKQKY